MTHSNAFFARGSELPFESHGEVMAVEIPQNKEISERGTTDGKKRVSSTIHQKRASKGSIYVKEEEQ